MAWPIVQLLDVAEQVRRPEVPRPGTPYPQVGVRLWGQGAYQRPTIDGSETKYSALYRVRTGDIVVNKIWARNGSVSVITDNLDESFVSSEFPTYTIDESSLLPGWFAWYSKTRDLWTQCDRLSRGTSGQNRLRPDRFLEVRLPLPPLDEQLRIVGRLDRVARLVARVRQLRERLELDGVALMQSLHTHSSLEQQRPFGEFVELWEDKEIVDVETSYPQVGIKGFMGGLFTKTSVKGSETSYRVFNRLHDGLLVVSQPKGWEGAVAICDQTVAGWYVSPEYRTFRCRDGQLLPGYLDMLIRTPWFQVQLTQLTRGQGARRQRLRPEMLLAMETTMPSVDAQATALKIIGRYGAVRTSFETSTADLDAFVPAILREVFADGTREILITYEPHVPGSTPAREPDLGY